MGMPTVNSVGLINAATTTITPGAGSPHTTDDIDILLLSSAGGAISLTTAAGFAEITGLTQVTGSETSGARVAVFWRRWNGSDGNPTTNDPGNVIVGRMISISGCKTSGDPWNVLATGTTDASADNTVSAAGAVTTANNCLVLAFCGQALPDASSTTQFGTPTNATLTNLTERIDNAVSQGLGQAIWMVSGEKATAGTYSATTCTSVTSSVRVCGSLALEGAPDTQALTGSLFTVTPTFNTGVVSTTYSLTGNLFTSTVSFPTGVVQLVGGPQPLDGVLFTVPVTFPTGQMTGGSNLFGSLFTVSPSFFTGAVTATVTLTGSLFTASPTFPTGAITRTYIGGIPEAAVIGLWDARSISGTAGTAVSSWPDIGPKGQLALSQATGSFQPTITDSGFGGIRSLLFDGVDDRMFCSALDQTYTGDFAFLAVLELMTYPEGSATVVYTTGSVPDYKNILGVDDVESPPGWVVMSGPEGTQAEHHHGNVIDLTATPCRVVMTQLVRDSGVHKLWERSVLVINESDSAQGDPLNNLTALKVGSREDDSRFMNMRLAYVMLVDLMNTDETTLLLGRDALGSQFAVPGMSDQALLGSLFTKTVTFNPGAMLPSVTQNPSATTSNTGWDTAPLAGQAIHTYLADDDADYVTVTVP